MSIVESVETAWQVNVVSESIMCSCDVRSASVRKAGDVADVVGIDGRRERERVVSNGSPDKVPLFEKILAGGGLVGFVAAGVSDTALTVSVLSVIVMALIVLFQDPLS
ncbi:MAG: hypothetical protein H8K05_03285 [Nitrospira sp.]|nr:hypothetical protein [Nitrospira sp.]